MKKYLMGGIAAVAICAAFTSCSKNNDVFDQNAVQQMEEQKKQEAINKNIEAAKVNYAAAFEKAFGKVGANVDWGFSSTVNSRALTRSFTPTHLSSTSSWNGWVSAPANADFKTKIPEDAISIDLYYNNNTSLKNYYLKDQENTQDINCWVGNANIYINGKKSLNFIAPGDGNDNFNYYILPDADVTFTSNYAYNAPHHTMYVAAGAKVTFNGNMSANIKLYNRGTVIIKGVTGPYANGAIYNDEGGVITCEKNLSVFNAGSQVINNGKITVASGVTVEGSGHFRNADEGNIKVTGTTLVNSNDCSWINDGVYTTDQFTYHAGSTDVINNCMLKVNGEFLINLGDTDKNCFLMNGGAGVEAGSLHFAGPGFIYMGSGSVFKVLGDAKMDATKDNYGFYGPVSGAPAVLHVVGNITTSNIAQGYDITYGNKIAVVATDHFDSNTGYTSKSGTYPIVNFSNCTKEIIYTAGSKPSIKITSGKCNPGFEGNDDQPRLYRVIAEDLNATEASDFDFNDVVFDVVKAENGKTTLRLIACGGIYKLTVAGVEVHEKFGQQATDDKYPMINTGAKANINGLAPVEFDINGTFDTPEKINNIEIRVWKPGTGDDGIALTAEKGKAACKILVDNSFEVVQEKQGIGNEYGLFQSYVRGEWDSIVDGKWWIKK